MAQNTARTKSVLLSLLLYELGYKASVMSHQEFQTHNKFFGSAYIKYSAATLVLVWMIDHTVQDKCCMYTTTRGIRTLPDIYAHGPVYMLQL